MTAGLRYVPGAAIRRLVSASEIRRQMRDRLAARRNGEDGDPPRFALSTMSARLGVMAGATEEGFGVKLVNLGAGKGHAGLMALFDAATGAVRGLLDAGPITALRTAAVSAAVTEVLRRERPVRRIVLVGSGAQSRAHAEAFADLYPAAEIATLPRGDRTLLRGADVVCTLTTSAEPVVESDDVREDVHVNAIGSCRPDHRELGGTLVQTCRRFVDSRAAAFREAGDLLLAGVDPGEEISGLFRGEIAPPRYGRTLFKALGLAVEDISLARLVLDRAEAR